MAASGGRVHPFTADVADETAVEFLVSGVLERFSRVYALINNAGINPLYMRAEDTSFSEWRQIVDVNLTGVFLV